MIMVLRHAQCASTEIVYSIKSQVSSQYNCKLSLRGANILFTKTRIFAIKLRGEKMKARIKGGKLVSFPVLNSKTHKLSTLKYRDINVSFFLK